MTKRSLARWTALAFAFAGIIGAAEKEKPLPKDLPPYGPLAPFVLPNVKQLKLTNGLALWLAPVPGFPKVSFAFATSGGSAMDPKESPGFAEMLASTITQGTTHRTGRQIAEQLQACGGDLEASAHKDYVSLQTSVLTEQSQPALAVLADIIRNPSFPDEEVESAKLKASATLEADEAEPNFIARRALYREMFGDHPYAVVSPTKDSIAKLTPSALKAAYGRRFRPDQSVLVIVGDFDPDKLESSVRKEFGSWAVPSSPADAAVPPPSPVRPSTVFYAPRQNSVQTTFYIGALAPTLGQSDYDAASLANAIFGGMFGSRLVLNIREDKGYTYSPHASLTPYQQTGVLITGADVRNAVTGATFNEISYELNRMATTTPEPEEVERAKRYSIGSLAVFLQPQASLANELAAYWANSLSPKDLAAEGEKLKNVSVEQIQDAGRKYFPMSRMTVVAVGDASVIKAQLAPLGLEFKEVE